MSQSETLDPQAIRKTERKALWVLISGGLFFIIAISSYAYAEYQYKSGQLDLTKQHMATIESCLDQTIEQARSCYLDTKIAHIARYKFFMRALKPYFWTIPLFSLTLATILGYTGLIWWGIYQPASRRPMVAISAIGMLLQTMLFIWLLVVRFIGLPSG